MARNQRWADLSPAARAGIVVGGAIELVVTSIALADLVRRPASEVRGPKVAWALGCFVQPVGAPLYLLAGRRRRAGA